MNADGCSWLHKTTYNWAAPWTSQTKLNDFWVISEESKVYTKHLVKWSNSNEADPGARWLRMNYYEWNPLEMSRIPGHSESEKPLFYNIFQANSPTSNDFYPDPPSSRFWCLQVLLPQPPTGLDQRAQGVPGILRLQGVHLAGRWRLRWRCWWKNLPPMVTQQILHNSKMEP